MDGDDEWEVDAILDKCTIHGVQKWLVSWKDYPSYENCWLSAEYLEGCEDLQWQFDNEYAQSHATKHARVPCKANKWAQKR